MFLAHYVHRVALSAPAPSSQVKVNPCLCNSLRPSFSLARWMHSVQRYSFTRRRPGCLLKIEFGTAESTEIGCQPVAPKKHGWLPVLVVLFLISYGLMTMLIVEQGRTIENQRALIHELFRDASELSAAKTKIQEQHIADQASAQQNLAIQDPPPFVQPNKKTLNHAPSTQAQAKQAPSSQVGTQQNVQNQLARPKTRVPVPTRPASEIADTGRSLITI